MRHTPSGELTSGRYVHISNLEGALQITVLVRGLRQDAATDTERSILPHCHEIGIRYLESI